MAADQRANVKAIGGAAAHSTGAKAEVKPLKRGDCALFEFSNNTWRVVVPAGVGAHEIDMHPTFWNALADEVREGDDIKAFAQDRAWVARFEVVDAIIGRAVVRLAYALEGAPRITAAGPKPFPVGYRIERTPPDEPDGYLVIRESDGLKIMDSGMPWKSYQACYEAFLKNAIFQTDTPTKYVP